MSCLVECYEENGMYYAVDEERVDPSQQQEPSESGDDDITGEIDHNVNEENEIHEDTSHNTGDATSDDTSNNTSDDESDSSDDAIEDSSDDSSNETNDETADEIDEQAKNITAEETSSKETNLRTTRQWEESDLETQTGITDHRRRSTKLSTKQGMSIKHSTESSTGSAPHRMNDPMPEESNCHSCTRFDSWDTMIACSHPHDGVERWFHLRCADVSPYAMPQDDGRFNIIRCLKYAEKFLEEWFCKDCKAQSEERARSKSNKTTRHHGETERIGESDDAPSAAGARHDNNDHQAQKDNDDIRDVTAQEDLNRKNQDDEELAEESVAEDDAEYSSGTDNSGEQRKNRRSAPISKRKQKNSHKPKLAAGATQQQAAPARIKKKSEPWTQVISSPRVSFPLTNLTPSARKTWWLWSCSKLSTSRK